MDRLGGSLALILAVALMACGPKLELEPAGPLFEEATVELDPASVVPFGAAPARLSPTVTSDGETLTLDLPGESLAEGWEVVLLEDGEPAQATPLAEGATRFELPRWADAAGVRAVHGALRGPVHWPAEGGSAGQGLGAPPSFFWTIDPTHPPQQLRMRTVDVTVSLLDPSGDDLVGSATLIFEPLVPLTSLELGVLGTVTAVRDGIGTALTFAPTTGGVIVDLGFSRPPASTVTLEVEWRAASFSVSRGGRVVADATPELIYAGDGVNWFPRPADLPDGAVAIDFAITAPAPMWAHTGGAVIARTDQGGGRTLTTLASTHPLRAWPLLAVGEFDQASAGGHGLSLAALSSGSPLLEPHAAELSVVLDFYVEQFGALPGDQITLVQVPDTFAVGFSGPGLVLIPTVRWDEAPSTWSRFLLAHELSHAYWAHASFVADLRDAWLIEGLADYCATRALELLAGPDAAAEHATDDLALLHQLIAEGYGGQPGRDMPVRPQDLGQLQDYIFYLKGAWVLRHLESALGRSDFDAGLAAYAAATRFADTETAAFQSAMQGAAGAELTWFWEQWLSGTGFPELAWEPFFAEGAAGLEVSLGLVQRRGISGDPSRPWQLPLIWSVRNNAGDPGAPAAFIDQGGCLRETREVIAPDDLPCGP